MTVSRRQAPRLSRVEDQRPTGRHEVTQAAIGAAAELFSQRGPNQVTVRDIATRAGVSHALVHRYLGSKDDILAAAIELNRAAAAKHLEELGETHGLADVLRTFDSDRPPGRYLRTVMLATLDGYTIPADVLRLPHAEMMTERVARSAVPSSDDERPFDPRLLLTAVTAMIGGMSLAGDFFLAQSGLEGADRETVQAEMDRLVARLFSMSG